MEKITEVKRYTTNKAGEPLVTKTGKPYTSIRIKVASRGDTFISGFGNAENALWKPGDEVDIVIEQKGEYLNFTQPKKSSIDAKLLQDVFQNTEFILNRLTGLKLTLDALDERTKHLAPGRALITESSYPPNTDPEPFPDFPADDINPDDVPF